MTHILTSIVKLDFDLTALLTTEKKRPLTEPMIDPMNFLMWIQLTPPTEINAAIMMIADIDYAKRFERYPYKTYKTYELTATSMPDATYVARWVIAWINTNFTSAPTATTMPRDISHNTVFSTTTARFPPATTPEPSRQEQSLQQSSKGSNQNELEHPPHNQNVKTPPATSQEQSRRNTSPSEQASSSQTTSKVPDSVLIQILKGKLGRIPTLHWNPLIDESLPEIANHTVYRARAFGNPDPSTATPDASTTMKATDQATTMSTPTTTLLTTTSLEAPPVLTLGTEEIVNEDVDVYEEDNVMNIKEGQWTLRGGELPLEVQTLVDEDGRPELWTEEDWRRFFEEEHARLDTEVDAWRKQGEEAEEGQESDGSEGLEYAPIVQQVGNEPDFDLDLFTRSSIDLLDDLESRVITWTEEMMQEPEGDD